MWMAFQIKKWSHIFSTSGAIVLVPSLVVLGTVITIGLYGLRLLCPKKTSKMRQKFDFGMEPQVKGASKMQKAELQKL